MPSDDWFPAEPDEIDLLTKKEVAELLRVTPRTVERLVKAGELRQVRFLTTVRFHRRDVVELVRRRTYG